MNETGDIVNVNYYYSNEPAPMGITDFGINPNTSTAYMYSTTCFFGQVRINSLQIHNATGINNGWASIQLNVNLKYNMNGVNYSYWLQDVMQIYSPPAASNAQITFLDNIWNATSPLSNMTNNLLVGDSGSIGTVLESGHIVQYYYDRDMFTYPTLENITYPSTVQFEINSTYEYGAPEISFAYNLGYGWLTYQYDVVRYVFDSKCPRL